MPAASCADYTALLRQDREFASSGFLGSVAVREGIAYAAASDGLHALRANGNEFEELGRFSVYAVAVRLRGDYAYVASERELHFVDLTDPASLTGGTALELPFSLRHLEIGSRYGVAAGLNEFVVLDFFSPQEPSVVSTTDLGVVGIYDLELSGNTLFLATDTGLRIYDLSDRAHPEEVTRVGSDPVESAMLQGDLLALAVSGRGVATLDVSDPLDPTELAAAGPELEEVAAVALTGDRVYLGAHGGVYVYSHDSGRHLVELGFAATGEGFPTEWLRDGDDLYLANGSLRVFREGESRGSEPLALPNDLDFVLVAGDLLVSAVSNRVVGYDLSTPQALRESFSFEVGAPIGQLAFDGGALWVGTRSALEEWLVDGDTITSGRVLEIGPPIDAVTTGGGFVYVSTATELAVVDPSGPELEVVGHVPTAWLGGELVAADDVVYVSRNQWGFQAFDVSNPEAPALLGSRGFTPNPTAVSVSSDGRAAAVAVGSELRFVDPHHPDGVVDVDSAILPFRISDLASSGGTSTSLRLMESTCWNSQRSGTPAGLRGCRGRLGSAPEGSTPTSTISSWSRPKASPGFRPTVSESVLRVVLGELGEEPRPRELPVALDGLGRHAKYGACFFQGQPREVEQLHDLRLPTIVRLEPGQRAVQLDEIDRRLLRGEAVRQRHLLGARPALQRTSTPCVVDEDATHHGGGEGDDVCAVLRAEPILVG
ncbi:MAG: hypothetical protein R3E97_19355 [Candidatus Eisenbacteria bacterium]